MTALAWEAIERRYGIDVPGLCAADPETTCAVVEPAGVFWRSRKKPRDASEEMFLIRMLMATAEPEFLYLEVGPGGVGGDTIGRRLSELENLVVGPAASGVLPGCRHYILRPLRTGEDPPDPHPASGPGT